LETFFKATNILKSLAFKNYKHRSIFRKTNTTRCKNTKTHICEQFKNLW